MGDKRRQVFARCSGCKSLAEYCTCLPEGATCGDCYAFKHCEQLMQRKTGTASCDYLPIRFRRPQRAVQCVEHALKSSTGEGSNAG